MLYLGCHVSMKASGYFLDSCKEAYSYDANAFMIYTGPPSNSKRKPIEMLKIEEGRKYMQEHGIDMDRVIVHAPYIINLANTLNPDTFNFGVDFLKDELERTSEIGSKILVLHPGSHIKAGIEVGISSIAKGLNEVLVDDPNDVSIALETMAGKGSEIGSTFEELAMIKSLVNDQDRIKFCLDTCHIHDAGYDLTDVDGILDQFDHILGLDALACIHLNDSKNIRGSHSDRHANIGMGKIGFESLYQICYHPKLKDVTKILETPYVDGKPIYKKEIAMLRA